MRPGRGLGRSLAMRVAWLGRRASGSARAGRAPEWCWNGHPCRRARASCTSLSSPVARAVWASVATRWAFVVGRAAATRYAFVWPMPSWRLAVVAAGVRSGLVPGVCVRLRSRRVATWLILPVVICLSQRLSHACLSISDYTVKLRMAH